MAIRFETERLVVHTFEARDGEAWVEMFSDPEVTRHPDPEDLSLGWAALHRPYRAYVRLQCQRFGPLRLLG